ncbi:MAG: dihydroorotate dehydrogenase [Pirellulaceae bacterium]|nr:dihydroorotate dehydrogenase [Pirellulaceae bacterium]
MSTNANEPRPGQSQASPEVDLRVQLGRLTLRNPILTASGTFGYAREMAGLVDLSQLGGVLPKTITLAPRAGNTPWRTVETSAGLLNSIGLDNDGVDAFIAGHLPYLRTLDTAVIVSIAGKSHEEFVELAKRLEAAGPGVAALELNISCPNVTGGVDFGTDPMACHAVVSGVRAATSLPILAKLTPNVTRIVDIARAAADAGADAVCCINTLLGMAVDWRKRRAMLGNIMGGLSGPAIKPVALRCVYQIASTLNIPVVGIGGIATMDDVMEFIVAGASAVQIGTANYYDPTVSQRLVEQLPAALAQIDCRSMASATGCMLTQRASSNPIALQPSATK